LCSVLSQKEGTITKSLLASYNPRKRRGIPLKALCGLHRSRVKEILAVDRSFLTALKKVLTGSLRDLAHPRKGPPPTWKRWLHGPFVGCPLCRPLLWEERNLCISLIQFLDDVEFWKGFQRAPLLCLEHLEKCLAMAGKGKGFERLLSDQSAKLNHLLNELVRYEATGTHEESKITALNWLADFTGVPANDGGFIVSTEDHGSDELLPDQPSHGPAIEGRGSEEVLFENAKLRRKVGDLIQQLNEVETRAASLHYRCGELSETNKRLEMGFTGASAQARGLEKLVRDLRDQIKKLQEGYTENSTRAAS
jgi:hypothetical protein